MLDDDVRRSAAHVLLQALDDGVVADDDLAHHLVRVVRLSSGASVSATDGAGGVRMYRAVVVGRDLTLEAAGEARRIERSTPSLTVVSAIPKGDRVDWMVQKCTELGVDRIRLVHAERSVVRWKPDRASKQVPRLQRIADEALRQSRRLHRVEVVAPVDATEALVDAVAAEPGGRPLDPGDRCVAVGPEGGWTDDELACARDRVDLGPHVLRTETAAIAVCALLPR